MHRIAPIALLAIASISIAGDANTQTPANPDWHTKALRAAATYRQTMHLATSVPKYAHSMCMPVAPKKIHSSPEHTADTVPKKAYYLYATQTAGMWSEVLPEDVGQLLVKEAWTDATPTDSNRRGDPIPGSFIALFMMWREAPETPNTDDGWVYATVVPNEDEQNPQAWTVTEVGAIESCVKCHADAPGGGRVFGLTH